MGMAEFSNFFIGGQFIRGQPPFPMITYNELSYQSETRRQRFF